MALPFGYLRIEDLNVASAAFTSCSMTPWAKICSAYTSSSSFESGEFLFHRRDRLVDRLRLVDGHDAHLAIQTAIAATRRGAVTWHRSERQVDQMQGPAADRGALTMAGGLAARADRRETNIS